MRTWSQFLVGTLGTGAAASVATSIAAAVCARLEGQSAVRPINAVSHIVWGDEAAEQEEASCEYTLTGLILNGAAAVSWAALYEGWAGDGDPKKDAAEAILGGILVAGIASFVDYYVVPSRLTPGFEKCLSTQSLFAIYASLAAGLALSGWLANHEGTVESEV